LNEQAAKSEAEAKRVQSFIEQSQKDLAKVANQCKSAQSANEATLRGIEGKSKKSEAAAQMALNSLSLSDKVEALTGKHLKADKQIHRLDYKLNEAEAAAQTALNSLSDKVEALTGNIKQVKRDQQAQIQSLDDKLNQAEAATQQKLNILREDVGALRTDFDQALSQCKQVQFAQETMLQRLEEQSQKTEANVLKLHRVDTSHEVTLPTFIYSYWSGTDQLYRTSLVTGEHSRHRVSSYTFKSYCCWSEMPGGSLLITGGDCSKEVVRIDVVTFEVSRLRDMLTPRKGHAAVYHTQHLYVLGGCNRSYLSECERYVCAENRWEALPPLPRACYNTSGVVVESSLYALGGRDKSDLDLVQKLSLESLAWEIMKFWLPFAGYGIPCFKLRDTEVYLVVKNTLCSFTGLEVRPLKTLIEEEDICSFFGASYYRRGTLYCSSGGGAGSRIEIGSLSN
jgi:hypothetical protein